MCVFSLTSSCEGSCGVLSLEFTSVLLQNGSACSCSVRGSSFTWVKLLPVSGFKREEQGCNEKQSFVSVERSWAGAFLP